MRHIIPKLPQIKFPRSDASVQTGRKKSINYVRQKGSRSSRDSQFQKSLRKRGSISAMTKGLQFSVFSVKSETFCRVYVPCAKNNGFKIRKFIRSMTVSDTVALLKAFTKVNFPPFYNFTRAQSVFIVNSCKSLLKS